MEDYRRAYLERALDKNELDGRGRQVASAHLGGIAIECFLKAIVVQAHGISAWHDPEHNKPQTHGVRNPGHALMRAVYGVPKLASQYHALISLGHTDVQSALTKVQQPAPCGYISLRYEAVCNFDYADWKRAFDTLHKWISDAEKLVFVRP